MSGQALTVTFLNELALQSPWIGSFALLVSEAGLMLLASVPVTLAMLNLRDRFHVTQAFLVIVGALVAWVLADTIKYIFDTPRPAEVLEAVTPIISKDLYGAFPSGHTALATALAVGMLYYRPSWGFVMVIGAVLVGVSRVVLGVHWPFDIAGGLVLGSVTAIGVRLVYRRLLKRSGVMGWVNRHF
jgi:membrane-associated phospholipid phosphatase